MGRAPCCSKVGLHRGPWTPREDTLLTKYIQAHGEGHWRSLPKKAVMFRMAMENSVQKFLVAVSKILIMGHGAGFLVGDHDDDIVNGSDFEYQISQVFTGENTLEKLYEEYLQILKDEDDQVQLDSFAESLLI
ncbi:hypothetical protein Patl1_00638 [Pistacia atlantica]|uniref:Uncharacterized protein n=1 Tax=Pistacia atlantica TaxID=434234 RepID=A0ACC1C9G1_9ROSI|nr:hypothetical protein Patl1_00638 [Pistacia atlantica]